MVKGSEVKKHFKLYKAKKQWVLGCVCGLALAFGGAAVAQADVAAPATEAGASAQVVAGSATAQSTVASSSAISLSAEKSAGG